MISLVTNKIVQMISIYSNYPLFTLMAKKGYKLMVLIYLKINYKVGCFELKI